MTTKGASQSISSGSASTEEQSETGEVVLVAFVHDRWFSHSFVLGPVQLQLRIQEGDSDPDSKSAMGEEQKQQENKVEQKQQEQEKIQEGENQGNKEEGKENGLAAKDEKDSEKRTNPPVIIHEEIVLRVFMHCEGCARKVRRCLRGFPGVEEVQTDCRTHTVLVKGKSADPLKVLDRVQKKSHLKVELLTPLPPPPAEDVKKPEEDTSKPEEKNEPPVVTVLLKVHMHCEACAQEIQKRILKMKGVQSADPDLKASQVTVKGVFEAPKLVEYVYRRTGKHAVVVKQEAEKEEKGENNKEEAKEETKKEDGEKPKAEANANPGMEEQHAKPGGEEEPKAEFKKNEYFYYYPRYATEYVYPPQIFSDENPNACSIIFQICCRTGQKLTRQRSKGQLTVMIQRSENRDFIVLPGFAFSSES